ncbi:hypothetical protein J5N97_029784 [Dioscorea zingiberensis]|uniref:Uncharacterized protein n=1 Tax=Dioscorea zingiberensis TaxID=325984 RepID=A0A9D5BWB3_9LILI|nr:hypothetical protein J5N97_029784 [Dioscorea zingiberensis]
MQRRKLMSLKRCVSMCLHHYLDENKLLILAILENQNLGNLTECAQEVGIGIVPYNSLGRGVFVAKKS